MTKHDFFRLLTERIVILDGATGTELMRRGMPSGDRKSTRLNSSH